MVVRLIVGCFCRCGGTRRLKERTSGVVRICELIRCRLAEIPQIVSVVEGEGRSYLPRGTDVGIEINAACVGGTRHHFYTVCRARVETIEGFVVVNEVTRRSHVEDASVEREVGNRCALEMKLLTWKQGSYRGVAAITQKCAACRIYGSVCVKRCCARRVPEGGQVDSQADWCAIRELIVESRDLPVRIPLVVSDELVEADGCALDWFPINTAVPHICGVAPVLSHQSLCPLVDRTEAGTLTNILEVAEMRAEHR